VRRAGRAVASQGDVVPVFGITYTLAAGHSFVAAVNTLPTTVGSICQFMYLTDFAYQTPCFFSGLVLPLYAVIGTCAYRARRDLLTIESSPVFTTAVIVQIGVALFDGLLPRRKVNK
jgi:hypothetical protein